MWIFELQGYEDKLYQPEALYRNLLKRNHGQYVFFNGFRKKIIIFKNKNLLLKNLNKLN